MRLVWLKYVLAVTLLVGGFGCGRNRDDLSAGDKQRLNCALTYFVYAEANRQLSRIQTGFFSPRNTSEAARRWVLAGLRQPALVLNRERTEAHAGFDVGIRQVGVNGGGGLERWYVANPKVPLSDLLAQLFNDALVKWDARGRIWHLSPAYADDYEWARGVDRFKFLPAFYQDPFPATAH